MLLTSLSVLGWVVGPAPLALASTDLVDRQDTAVATNLGLFGGSPQDIEVDPTGDGQVVYVTTYTPNGIFTSRDGGDTWSGISGDVDYGAGKAIVVDPETGDVYVEIGDNVIKSTNQGRDWTSLTENMPGHPIMGAELGWVDDTLVVAVDSGNVQVSSDGGDTFTSVALSDSTDDIILSIDNDAAGNFYAVTQNILTDANRLFYSADQALTWTQIDVEAGGVPTDARYYGVVVDPLDDDQIILTSYHPDYDSYRSINGGSTWTALVNGELRIGGQQAAFDGVGGLYLGMFYTSDASVASPTWTALESDTPLSSVQGDLFAVGTTHPTTVFSNSSMGVAKSEDNGQTWVDSVEGITAVKTYSVAQADDKDVVWLGADGGLATTSNFTDAEPDWTYPVSPTESGGTIYTAWVKPTNGDYVVTGQSNFLYYTTDGGDQWTQADAPDFTGTVREIVQSPRSQLILYAMYVNTSLTEDAYDGGVLKSTDAGQTWVELDFPTTLADGALVVAQNGDHDVLYVGIGAGGDETGIYTYEQGEWTHLSEDFNQIYVNNLMVDPTNQSTLFASFEASSTVGSLYKSTDAGETWEQLSDGLEDSNHLGAMAMQTGDESTIYLAGQDGGTNYGMLYKSTDGGTSWSEYYQGMRQEFFYDLLFDGLISGNDRGVFNLKSLGKVAVQKEVLGNHRYRLRVTLKDAATFDRLGDKKLKLYKKVEGGTWKLVQHSRTNENGKHRFIVTAHQDDKLKLVWTPNEADNEEYASSYSRIVTIH